MFRLPYVDHPIFHVERRRIRGARTHTQLRASIWTMFLSIFTLIMLFWLVYVMWRSNEMGFGPSYNYSYMFLYRARELIDLLAGMAIIATLGADGLLVAFNLNGISREKNLQRWDLLCLSSNADDITTAKYTAGLLRGRRIMTVLLAMRVAVLCLYAIYAFILEPIVHQAGFALTNPRMDPREVVIMVVFIVILTAFTLFEPFWRLRTMTAIGLALSAAINRLGMAALASIFAVMGFWLAQGGVMIGIVWFVAQIVNRLSRGYAETWLFFDSAVYFILIIMTILLVVAGEYVLYWGVQRFALWRVRQSIR